MRTICPEGGQRPVSAGRRSVMKHLLVLVDVLCCGLPEDIIVEEVKEHLLF
jgi:hypothetical protein